MFSLANNGLLTYDPTDTYHLPILIPTDTDTPIEHPGPGRHPPSEGYRLRWPGEMHPDHHYHHVRIPSMIVDKWLADSQVTYRTDPLLIDLIAEGNFPENLPTCVAHHLAVNHEIYFPDQGVQYPVAGLSPEYVQKILSATFALDGKAFATLEFLKWTAESYYAHPLLQRFDSVVRDHLNTIDLKPAQLFFYLLFDHQYDADNKNYSINDTRLPHRLATFLHWTGHISAPFFTSHAGINGPGDLSNVSKLCGGYGLPDVFEAIDGWWLSDAGKKASDMSRVEIVEPT